MVAFFILFRLHTKERRRKKTEYHIGDNDKDSQKDTVAITTGLNERMGAFIWTNCYPTCTGLVVSGLEDQEMDTTKMIIEIC